MAIVAGTLDSWTASIGTERTVGAAVTSASFVQLHLDASALAAGEVLVVKCYAKLKSGGTERLVHENTIVGALGQPYLFTVPVTGIESVRYSVTQTTGTGRAFEGRVVAW